MDKKEVIKEEDKMADGEQGKEPKEKKIVEYKNPIPSKKKQAPIEPNTR